MYNIGEIIKVAGFHFLNNCNKALGEILIKYNYINPIC